MDSALPQLSLEDLISAASANGAPVRSLPWSETLLGPWSEWPQSLKSIVGICMNAVFPALICWGPERLVIHNEACAPLIAAGPSGALGKPAAEAFPEFWERIEPALAGVMERGEATRLEHLLLLLERDGVPMERSFTFAFSPIFGEGGGVDGVFATAHENTERTLNEQRPQSRMAMEQQALLAWEEEIRYTFELDFHIRWIADADGYVTELSQRWLEMTGLSREDGLGQGWRAIQHPDDLARVEAAWLHSVRTGQPLDMEHRLRTAEGSYRWMRLRALPRRDSSGKIVKWYGTHEDVDDRKRAEIRLQENERRMRVAQEAAGVLIWEWCTETEQINWGAGVERLYGRPASELTFGNWLSFLHPEDREKTRRILGRVIRERRSYETEYRVIWPDGSIHWLIGKGEIFQNTEDGQLYLIGANLDITARKHAEEAIRQRDVQLREVLERTTDAVFLLDSEWRFEYLNAHAEQLIAAGRDLVGKNLWVEFPDALKRNFYSAYHRAREEGVAVQFEEYYPQPLDKWFEVHAYPTAEGLAVFFRDVTQKHKSHAALLQSEKLAAAGRLAASIAHEINNPLEGITNLLYLLENNDRLDIQSRRFVSMAQNELSRVSKIANQTLRFYRQSTNAAQVKLEDLLESAVALYQLRYPNSEIAFERQFRPAPAFVAFEGELRQVFANLVSNAADALGAGGRIVLRTRMGKNWKTGERGVWALVADNGHGMAAQTMRRIFEPFFSTKGMDGTGLGLWVSREIVEKHGGRMLVRSRTSGPAQGASFAVFLPLRPAEQSRPPAAA